MSTFIMFGRYSPDATRQISRQRTEKATELIERFGGKVVGMYATLGATTWCSSSPSPATARR